MLWMIKTLGQDYGPFQPLLGRGDVMALILAPFALLRRSVRRISGTPLELAGRSLLAFGGQAMGIAAITALPLAQAQSLSFTKGFVVLALAAMVLHERAGMRQWVSMGVGMAGVMNILQPNQGSDPAGFLALCRAACLAASTIALQAAMLSAWRLGDVSALAPLD